MVHIAPVPFALASEGAPLLSVEEGDLDGRLRRAELSFSYDLQNFALFANHCVEPG